MLSSLNSLFKNPYNKSNKAFALHRFIYWKFIRLLKLKNIKYNLWADKRIYLNYDSFQCMWIMYNYIVDWEEFNFIKDFIKDDSQVFDIGANMGFYTIWMSKFINNGGKIHSFEPDNRNFSRLINNVLLNKIENKVNLNNLAVSDKDGELNFTIGLDGENHIDILNDGSSIKIRAKTLDTYANKNNISILHYVKLDVEGFEYSVLQGAENLLASNRISVLQLEINSAIKNSNKCIDDILNILNTYNYKLCMYNVDKKILIPINYTGTRENYFAVVDIDQINKKLSLNS